MPNIIHVAIVDDHQSIIDGYRFRLQTDPEIEVVGTTFYGEDIEPLITDNNVDVLLLDAHIPKSEQNASPYPTLILLPKLVQSYPNLHVLIISMHIQRSFIKYAMEMGASGYIVKDDYKTIENLAVIVKAVASGGVHLSQQATQSLLERSDDDQKLTTRQLEALSLCLAYPSETSAQLAQRLSVANSTMRNILSSAYLRLGARTRTAAVTEARRQGLLLSQE